MQATADDTPEVPTMPDAGVSPFYLRRDFLVNDLEHAPFGCSWLRGITPARLGLVELLSLIFSVRQSSEIALSWEAALAFVLFVHRNIAASVPMLLLVNLAERRTIHAPHARRTAALSVSVVAGALAYAIIVVIFYGVFYGVDPREYAGEARFFWTVFPSLGYFLRALLLGGLLTGVLYLVARESAIAAAVQSARLTRIALDKQLAEAQLHVLQAQIEPHFLFNTLAHVKRLYLIEPARGKAMLHSLTGYLRAALPQMRESNSTLGRELALASAYLDVLRARMGERLDVSVAIPQELRSANMPPMMLSTLVENAIKHGIAPLPQGGMLNITAAREGDQLKVSVADNGVGFQATSGGGVGLVNIRARLNGLYGRRGILSFAANPVRGVTVSIELPFDVRPDQGLALR
jgi:sensor histidine kinase YesM